MNISPEIINLIDEIKNDKTHGASELARQAVKVLKTAAERSRAGSTEAFLLEQLEIGGRLMSARPTMAPIVNIVSGLLKTIPEESTAMDLSSVKQRTISKADEAVKDSLQAVARIAEYTSQLIADSDRVMTHSYSSTVVAALKEAFTRHGNIKVVAARSGPGRTGERIARELALHGVPVAFIDDAAMGLYLAAVNKVIVGADRVCANGKIINGIGTYPLALAAKRANIPFYVLSETLKFDSRLTSGQVDLEEKEPSEIIAPGRLPPQVRVKNPNFDITPLELVTGIVTEKGLLMPEEVARYIENLANQSDRPGPASP